MSLRWGAALPTSGARTQGSSSVKEQRLRLQPPRPCLSSSPRTRARRPASTHHPLPWVPAPKVLGRAQPRRRSDHPWPRSLICARCPHGGLSVARRPAHTRPALQGQPRTLPMATRLSVASSGPTPPGRETGRGRAAPAPHARQGRSPERLPGCPDPAGPQDPPAPTCRAPQAPGGPCGGSSAPAPCGCPRKACLRQPGQGRGWLRGSGRTAPGPAGS